MIFAKPRRIELGDEGATALEALWASLTARTVFTPTRCTTPPRPHRFDLVGEEFLHLVLRRGEPVHAPRLRQLALVAGERGCHSVGEQLQSTSPAGPDSRCASRPDLT
jgi:hypothetical protein